MICFTKCSNFVIYTDYRHRRQEADLPAKVAKRIGCAHIRGCSFEMGWSRIFGRILGQFLCQLSMQDNLFCQHTEKSRDLSGQIPSNATSELYRDRPKQANCKKSGSKYGLQGCIFLPLEKKGSSKACR